VSAPAATVVIPSYNRAAFLRAAMASVLNQTIRDLELIVVDDGSTDETPRVLQDAARGDSRIRVVRNDGDHGPGAARNAGIAQARGDWIAFLDSDDLWEPDKLVQFLAVAQRDVAMIGSDYRLADRASGHPHTMREFVFGTMLPWWESDPAAGRVIDCARLRSDIQALTDPKMMIGMTIGGFLWPQTSSVMARRSDLEAVGGFDTKLARTEDMDLWFKLMRRGRVAYVDRVLASYDTTGRAEGAGDRYASQAKGRRHDAYREMHFHLRFLKSMPKRAALDEDARAYLAERIAAGHRRCGHAACGPVAIGHYAAALLHSAEQRRLLRRDRRGYFARPY
jgi:glycosyltransferase involved in cell wall biosynthesis